MACQHPEGGFGGGPGQFAHLLPTYAAVSALAVVGRPGPGGGWDQIDRCATSPILESIHYSQFPGRNCIHSLCRSSSQMDRS